MHANTAEKCWESNKASDAIDLNRCYIFFYQYINFIYVGTIKMLTFCELIDFMSNLWVYFENKHANHACKDESSWVLLLTSFESQL